MTPPDDTEVRPSEALAAPFPAADEFDRYIEHGKGLGYVHGVRVQRVHPCGIYVWPDEDGRWLPRQVTTRPGDRVTCPRCLAAMEGGR